MASPATRESILAAADRLFGQVGFNAATTREIAELSGVNKALIHYHFRSKEALFESVLDSYYERLNSILFQAMTHAASTREKLLQLIDSYVDFLSQNLNFSRIVQRESAGGPHIDRIRGHLFAVFEAGMAWIQDAYPKTRAGEFTAHHVLISFYGMIVSYFTYSGIVERLVGRDPLSPEEIELRKRHLHRMTELLVEELEKRGMMGTVRAVQAPARPSREAHPGSGERIARLRARYQSEPVVLSIERAKHYTESWRRTEGEPLPIRVALAMKNVYENMTHYLDPDDRIAGYWTEFFLGCPIDIEKGVFNQVLEAEIDKKALVAFRARSLAKGLVYMARKRMVGEFLRNQRIARRSGAPPLNLELKTMSERQVNPYRIRGPDRAVLLKQLLPYWKGRTIVDRLEKELAASGLYSRDMHEFVVAIPGNTSRQVVMLSTCATISTIQGHVILDYEKVLRLGLKGMRAEVGALLARATPGENHAGERDFLRSVDIALEGVTIYALRLAERIQEEVDREADPEHRTVLGRMLETCRKVPLEPAETFEQAVQSLWTVKTAVEIAHPINLHCFGRLDQNLWPYYRADLEAGRTTPEAARELLEELLLKIMSQNIRPESNILGNFYHRYLGSSPVTVGGLTRDGRDATNDLTYLFLEAADRSKAVTNLSVRVHPGTPDALLLEVADRLHRGTSNLSLFNDTTHIDAMERRGFSTEDARDYAVMGCVEATSPGRTGSMSASALLLSRLLDITLRGGDSRTIAGTLRSEGLETGDAGSFRTFDELLGALGRQGRHFIRKIVEASNLRDRLYADCLPAPLISAFMEGCLEKRRDVTRAGAKYDLAGISMINSIANLVDSLHVIRKLVFEEKRVRLEDLVRAMDRNYEGDEDLLREIRRLPGKWGNGCAETDELARRVMKDLFEETYQHRTHKGGPFVVYVISMITHTVDGRLSIATPDGRKAATPFAASCNPYNVERSGLTAALRSVAALPFEDVMGSAVNVKLHPTAIGENEPARRKWVSLIRTYFQLGGSQLQPTAASAETLRAAQAEPDRHRDLIVKVGGYSTYFVDLGREIQNEVIARTEHHTR